MVHIGFAALASRKAVKKIEWMDWSKESFDKASSTGKPILLDIKGSWCHWCHVMDQTSYSDPSIIDTISKHFIPIRVDTDKRPDVNRRYNLGGWPTTAFLNNEGQIITGGTYIPPEQLREVLRSVLEFYSKNKGAVKSKLERPRIPKPGSNPLTNKIIRDISTTIAVNFDIDYGGFGFEPKFPHSDALDLALIRYKFEGENEMLKVATKTLDMMAQGGTYDQVEGGFFRYSTTRDWSIPHFEKMAEDNAKLLGLYLRAYHVTNKPLYKKTAEGIIQYTNTTLSDQTDGGFYGSQDADEEYYKLDLAERRHRRTPSVDKTFYTNYNALFISSYFLASKILSEPSLAKFAVKTLERLLAQIRTDETLPHYWDASGGAPNGLLVDSSAALHALLDAYEYTGQKSHLATATRLANSTIKLLHDEAQDGFYDLPTASSELGQLKLRDKPIDENSQMAVGLLRLSWLTGKETYAVPAEKTLHLFSEDYEKYGLMAATYGLALDSVMNGPLGITILGSSDKGTKELRNAALNTFPARRYVLQLDPDKDKQKIEDMGYDSSRAPVAYVCVVKTCGPPVDSPSELSHQVEILTTPVSAKQ
jgi:uncharacterized protein YyaL (SSP411 family)